jgi:hypothetical protein
LNSPHSEPPRSVRSTWRWWPVGFVACVPFIALICGGRIIAVAKNSPNAPPFPAQKHFDSDDTSDEAQRDSARYGSKWNTHHDYYEDAWRRAIASFFAIQAAGVIVGAFAFLRPRDGTGKWAKIALASSLLIYLGVTFIAYIGWGFRYG